MCVCVQVCVTPAVVPIGVDLDTLTTGSLDGPDDVEEETAVFDKHDDLLHGIQMGKKWVEGGEGEKVRVTSSFPHSLMCSDIYVTKAFLRKYIHVARNLKVCCLWGGGGSEVGVVVVVGGSVWVCTSVLYCHSSQCT